MSQKMLCNNHHCWFWRLHGPAGMWGGGMDQVPRLWQQQQIHTHTAPGILLCPVPQSGGAVVNGEVNWIEVPSLASEFLICDLLQLLRVL